MLTFAVEAVLGIVHEHGLGEVELARDGGALAEGEDRASGHAHDRELVPGEGPVSENVERCERERRD